MNRDIEDYLNRNQVRHWQCARHLGISEYTFSHWFREEICEEKKKLIFQAVDEICFARKEMERGKL